VRLMAIQSKTETADRESARETGFRLGHDWAKSSPRELNTAVDVADSGEIPQNVRQSVIGRGVAHVDFSDAGSAAAAEEFWSAFVDGIRAWLVEAKLRG